MSIIRRRVPKHSYSSEDELIFNPHLRINTSLVKIGNIINILQGQCHNRLCHNVDECPSNHIICAPFLNDTTALYWKAARELKSCIYVIERAKTASVEWRLKETNRRITHYLGRLWLIKDLIDIHHGGSRISHHFTEALELIESCQGAFERLRK